MDRADVEIALMEAKDEIGKLRQELEDAQGRGEKLQAMVDEATPYLYIHGWDLENWANALQRKGK